MLKYLQKIVTNKIFFNEIKERKLVCKYQKRVNVFAFIVTFNMQVFN